MPHGRLNIGSLMRQIGDQVDELAIRVHVEHILDTHADAPLPA